MPVSDYFQPLMKRLRTYIARLLVTLLVCSGFSLYMVQPARAGQAPDDFARWLSMMAEASDAPGLQKELQDLKSSGGQLADMLEYASQIVTENNDEFDFPFAKEETSRELYQLLLIEWNQFQTGNAMDGIPVQQTVKSSLLLHIDKTGGLGSATAWPCKWTTIVGENSIANIPPIAAHIMVEPMSGGIAIGAP